jgi:hypothetical protein
MKKDKDKKMQKSGKNETSIVRSSAAEYLTFVAAGGDSETSVEMRYEDENIRMPGKSLQSWPKLMLKVNLKNTASFRIDCLKAISIGC